MSSRRHSQRRSKRHSQRRSRRSSAGGVGISGFPLNFHQFLYEMQMPESYVHYYQSFTKKELQEFAQVMKNRPRGAKYLTLYGNKLGDYGAQAIGSFLPMNESIKSLKLTGNKIGVAGAAALAEGLKANRTLEELDLQNNLLNDDAILKLAKLFTANTTLKKLILFGNDYSRTGITALTKVLQVNKDVVIIGHTNRDMRYPNGPPSRYIPRNRSLEATPTPPTNRADLETEVGQILRRLNLDKYAPVFYEEQIRTKELASELQMQDFELLGVSKIGERLAMQRAFRENNTSNHETNVVVAEEVDLNSARRSRGGDITDVKQRF